MSANDTQVAGSHYKTSYQHWDLAAELDLGYFEGQITKYVSRHASKKGQEDALKALHFAQKLRELHILSAKQPRHRWPSAAMMVRYVEANNLTQQDLGALRTVTSWSDVNDLNMLIDVLVRIVASYDKAAEPTAGYVNQDR